MTSLIFKNNTNNVTNIVPGTITSNVNLTLPNSNGTIATREELNSVKNEINNTITNTRNEINNSITTIQVR